MIKSLSHSIKNDPQLKLFESGDKVTVSSADPEKCKILHEISILCKHNKLGVSLNSHKGLRTMDPKNPINFWWYEPQTDLDKAPT